MAKHDKYYGLVRKINTVAINNRKKSYLNKQQSKYSRQQEQTKKPSMEKIEGIREAINDIQKAKNKISDKKFLYDRASEVASNFKPGNRPPSKSKVRGDIEKFETELFNFISQTGVSTRSLKGVKRKILKIAERNISSKDGNKTKVSDIDYKGADADEIDRLTNNIFKDVDGARTSFARLTTLMKKVGSGNLDKYSGDSLYKGIVGYVSNLTGLIYEIKLYELLKNKNLGEVIKSGSGTKTGVQSFVTKSDLQISLPSVDNGNKKLKSLYGMSVKSYKVTRQKGVKLHTGGIDSFWGILDEPIGLNPLGTGYSPNNISKVVFQAAQDNWLSKFPNSIRNMPDIENVSKTKVGDNLINIIKNILYYNFSNLIGRDINLMVGSQKNYTVAEIIKLLQHDGNKLYTRLDGSKIGVYMNISKGE